MVLHGRHAYTMRPSLLRPTPTQSALFAKSYMDMYDKGYRQMSLMSMPAYYYGQERPWGRETSRPHKHLHTLKCICVVLKIAHSTPCAQSAPTQPEGTTSFDPVEKSLARRSVRGCKPSQGGAAFESGSTCHGNLDSSVVSDSPTTATQLPPLSWNPVAHLAQTVLESSHTLHASLQAGCRMEYVQRRKMWAALT